MTRIVEQSRVSFAPKPRSARALGRAFGLLACAALLTRASSSFAQSDTNPPMTNTLLLVDTSGSMEYKSSNNAFPACRYDANGLVASPPTTSEKSRWTDLIEVLTGSIVGYDCQTLDRGSTAFKNEYKISNSNMGANSPYDFLYSNAYHRPMSTGCVVGPGSLNPLNAADFPSNAFNYHTYNNTTLTCTYTQQPDGILDAWQNLMRFGLMTFDTDPSPDQGELGNYSYVVGTSHVGLPAGCTTPSAMEVGARNAYAPPWEGRLIPFGDPAPGSLDYLTKNQQIQQVLRATRPYGATPIAGMLSDARDFLRTDATSDPVDNTKPFGPKDDPYAACRQTQIVLLSDGQPNMDLRGHCNGTDCPFQLPEQIANDLLTKSAPRLPVKTFVVGFALNTLNVSGSNIDCSKISDADLDASSPSALCTANPDNASLQACCNLARIAVAGDDSTTHHAYFANDRTTLQASLSSILSAGGSASSRTQAAFGLAASGSTASTFAASYRFFSGFKPATLQPWAGSLRRERWTCDATSHVPSAKAPDVNQGDLFADNLNTESPPRTFYTVQVTASGGNVYSDRTVRPNLTTNPDGVGALTGSVTTGPKATFVSNTSAASMGLTDTSCTDIVNGNTVALTAAQCRDRYLKWLVGIDNGTPYTRCGGTGCNLMGDIFHSTPKVVPPPSEFTHDDSYQAFQTTYSPRPQMLYTSTNDGFLHAFKVSSNVAGDSLDVKSKKNNELWAFMPPQVLPHVSSEYPFTHQILLDGRPVVKDVVARKTSGTYPYVFERTVADAAAGLSPNVTWRTILIQSFGGTYPGYFALDITNPDPGQTINSEVGGPRFLWQITSDASGTPLFGTGGATPIITTLLVDEDGTGAREVPVAILPGGIGDVGSKGTGATPGCPRASVALGALPKISDYVARTNVPCYTTNLGARSLTVVRLDNGKILRTFRRSKTEVPTAIQGVVTESPLDSPMTGEPIAYPSDVGAVSDRVFIGDQDGALWKADFSNVSPAQWSIKLFWDTDPAFSIHGQPAGTWNTGQPIQTPPVLSVDQTGNITIAVSTGDQNALGSAPSVLNWVWALRDLPDASHVFSADLLWLQQFTNGERVTGPISLFNSFLYFSSVTPAPPSDICGSGTTNVWGEHYMIPRDGVGTPTSPPDRTVGGQGSPVFNSTNFPGITPGAQSVSSEQIASTTSKDQTVIFGVTVAQVPNCYDSQDVPTDAYIGGHTQVSNVNPGKFQLVMQTGAASGTAASSAASSTTANTVAVDLPPLATPSHIDGWASIVE